MCLHKNSKLSQEKEDIYLILQTNVRIVHQNILIASQNLWLVEKIFHDKHQ